MPALCFDIDNVVARTDEVMREVIREYSQNHVDLAYEDVVCFDYWRCRDSCGRRFERTEWEKIHSQFTLKHLLQVQPFDNVQYHLARLAEWFDVHLATSRLHEGRETTLSWLTQHRIPYCELHFVNHGEKHLIKRDFMVAVDDDREQGYAFFAKGVRVLLMAHPWNEIGRHSPLTRVASWDEICRGILGQLR